MSFLTLLFIAVGLGMDAFAVAISTGVKCRPIRPAQILRMSAAFGLFQFLMPLIGWLAGSTVIGQFQAYDHWIAFGLLAIVGGHMAWAGLFEHEDADKACPDPTRGWTLALLAVATSIDALAVGVSLSMLGYSLWYPAALIGVVAFFMTAVGMLIGAPLGVVFGKRMEVVGGLVLIGIGVKILLEHMK